MSDEKAALGKSEEVNEKTPFNEDQEDVFDSSKVQFINGGAKGDTSPLSEVRISVDESGKKKKEDEFCGLTKEELLEFADDPFWVKVRWVLLILFWCIWIGMLAGAVIIIIVAPKCPPRPKLDWYTKSAVYQVYPRSFQDSNGDGVGDIKGIHDKLDHFIDLNVSTIWLNSISKSTNYDFGYDVTDYKAINAEFGTMEDFENLIAALHKKSMRLMLDFVPNHTSQNHTWFQESSGGDDNDYKDYYVWHDGDGQGGFPNDWLTVYGEPAWTYVDARQQYYYHHHLPQQPDLNLRNPAVIAHLKDAMAFWLSKGVDGFYLDSAAYLFESDMTSSNASSYSFLPESYQLITEFRSLLDSHSKKEGRNHPRVLIVDVNGTDEQLENFYKYNDEDGANMVLNSQLLELESGCHAQCVSQLIKKWRLMAPEGMWNNWRTGSLDSSRVATRMGREWVNALNMLTMTLPGVPFVYYGEEIGMVDVNISFADTMDYRAKLQGEGGYEAVSNDPQRTPLQWSDSHNANFTSANNSWLPVADDYVDWNVKTLRAHGSGRTTLEVFERLTALCSEPSMLWGGFSDLTQNDNVLVYERSAQGFDTFLVAINFGDTNVATNLKLKSSVPEEGYIVATTKNFNGEGRADAFEMGTHVPLENVKLHPGEGIVVGWPFNPPDPSVEA